MNIKCLQYCTMKLFLALSAVALCTRALPTRVASDFETEIDWATEAEVAAAHAANVTNLQRTDRSLGFASFGSGTRGGQGGAEWTVWDAWALRDAVSTNAARIVYVRGRIDLTALFVGSPGVIIDVGSWKTIIGGDANAEITGGGLRIKNVQQVIIQNIKFNNALSYAPGEQPNGAGGIVSQVAGEFTDIDAVLCETAEYVWIDHNEFSDDPWIANTVSNDRMRHDGLVDIKRGSNYVTVSHNIFRNHNKNILVGHSDSNAAQDQGKLKTSFVKNWFMGTTQRNPRVRFGEVHVLNNLYTDIGTYGIGAGAGASIYAERNVFVNTRAWRHPDGTPSPLGYLLQVMNQFQNSNFDAVPSDGVTWNPAQYFWYQAQAVNFTEDEVRQIAGTWS